MALPAQMVLDSSAPLGYLAGQSLRFFEPFLTTRMGGTGLGLPIVHRAVEAHRGQILYRSDGAGTRFDLYLPTVQPEPGASR